VTKDPLSPESLINKTMKLVLKELVVALWQVKKI